MFFAHKILSTEIMLFDSISNLFVLTEPKKFEATQNEAGARSRSRIRRKALSEVWQFKRKTTIRGSF